MAHERYDCVVIGLGGHGSAALYHLAQKGLKVVLGPLKKSLHPKTSLVQQCSVIEVLGIEQHTIAHDKGSSHGESRIIRIAYHEHPDYVPLLQRAWELWLDLQKKSGKFLLCDTKCIEACNPNLHGGSNCFQKALLSAQEHNLEHEVLNAEDVNSRFPGYNLPSDFKALLGPGGILASERCIEAHIDLARKSGATIKLGERVVGWQAENASGEVTVRTESGSYTAKQLVLAAGAWNTQLVPELQAVLKVERQVIGWFEIMEKSCCHRDSFPVGIIDSTFGNFYYFPEFEKPGMKIGKFNHLWEEVDDPANLDCRVTPADEQALRDGIAEWFPAANGKMISAAACMFTNTPDRHFIVDKHPNHPNVVICSPCSGHGFKFCSVVGEVIADMLVEGTSHTKAEIRDKAGILKLRRGRPGFDQLYRRFEKNKGTRSRL